MTNLYRLITSFVFCLLTPISLWSQQQPALNALSFKANAGLDIAKTTNGARNYLYGLHLSYDWGLAASNADWIRILNAKTLSLGVLWHNMNNMAETVEGQSYPFGQAIGLVAEVDFQLVQAGPVKLFFTPGVGLTYITETIFTQPETSTVGSHLNMALTGELGLEIPLNDRLSLLAATNILHYSNGGMQVPNGGINTINASLGLKTTLGNALAEDRKSKDPAFATAEGGSAELVVGMGRRGRYRTHGAFLRTGVYGGYNYFINQAIGFKGGVDMVYYHHVFDGERFDETFQYYASSYDRIRLGLSIGAEAAMGRFAVNGMFGRYLHFNSFHGMMWYWSSALRYYVKPYLGLQSTLYMHRIQADYLNWGVVLKI